MEREPLVRVGWNPELLAHVAEGAVCFHRRRVRERLREGGGGLRRRHSNAEPALGIIGGVLAEGAALA